MTQLFFELHDHANVVQSEFSSTFANQCTLVQMQEKIRSIWLIVTENQQLFFEDGQKLKGLDGDSLQSLGLNHGGKVIVKHTLLPKWQIYLTAVQEFHEVQENRLKKKRAFEAYTAAEELYEARFFSVYALLHLDWMRMRKEYATLLEILPIHIKEAAKSFFIRKFSNKLIEVDFKDKPSGTRSGTMCIVSFDETRRVFYVKINHNTSSICIIKRGPLNMIELFIYKFLEILGVGAAVDFIPNVVASDKIVYICGEEIEAFKTLYELQTDWNGFERRIVKKKGVIAKAIIQLSLLTQILGLGDLNAENLGFKESVFSLFCVDFQTGFIDTSVAFEGINCPNTPMSSVAQLKNNLGRFLYLVNEMTFEEQLEIAKEYIVQWEISSKLDVAFAKLDEEKEVFKRADSLFGEGTEALQEYILVVRKKISMINNL